MYSGLQQGKAYALTPAHNTESQEQLIKDMQRKQSVAASEFIKVSHLAKA
jgi:hypothetical protein